MHWRWIVAGLGIGSLVLIALNVPHIRLPPRTYREAVMQILDERQIAYDVLTIDTGCPPSPHCFSAGSFIIPLTGYVAITSPHPARGQINCAQKDAHGHWTRCTLSIPAYGMRDVPLPPLAHELPWWTWLVRAWRSVGTYF